ncbi:MAG: type II toxin-antitoxin system VapC family toxin [Sphingobacteriaceae bacterium]|nr:type II toxin-antitoxin system VapC family toxin [Cytophagaceae bacterium]
MNGNKVVLDSNIIIYLTKKQVEGTFLLNYDEVYVSIVAYMEVLGFHFTDPQEQQGTEEFLRQVEIIHTDFLIADFVIGYRKTRKIKLPDAITLATARRLNADLITVNEQDFRGLDPLVRIVVPPLIDR